MSCPGLVVAGGVDGEFAQELAGGGVDHAHLVVLNEQDDVGSGVGSSDADVAQGPGHAQGDGAGAADPVVTDTVSVSRLGPGRTLGIAS